MFFSVFSLGQSNLILNGNFEEYWICPDDATQIERCKNVFNPLPFNDLMLFSSTSDYYNACSVPSSTTSSVDIPYTMNGFQLPRSGSGMLGFLSIENTYSSDSHREYVQLTFEKKLVCGNKYEFTAYFNPSNFLKFSRRGLAFYFSEKELNEEQDYLYNLYEPSYVDLVTEINDTSDWTKVSFNFIADKPYKYVSIGHTKNDDTTMYFAINSSGLGQDTAAYFYMDDASLIEVGQSNYYLPNVFTPNGDGVNELFMPIGETSILNEIIIFNRWGNKVSSLFYPFEWNGTGCDLELPNGVYFYLLIPNEGCEIDKKQGMVHLIR